MIFEIENWDLLLKKIRLKHVAVTDSQHTHGFSENHIIHKQHFLVCLSNSFNSNQAESVNLTSTCVCDYV